MRSRGMVGVIAFGLTAVATLTIFLYVHSVKRKAETGGAQATVIVSKKDIPAGTNMDTLISQGSFTTQSVLAKDEVSGAVTSLQQLRGRVSSVPILTGEQIPAARLQGSTNLPGGALGIPAGMDGETIQLETQRIIGGVLQQGDHVQVLESFAPPVAPQYVTVVAVPDVKVLRVARSTTTQQTSQPGVSLVTMALRPQDAQRVTFGMEHGTVWLSILPPGQTGHPSGPLYIGALLK